jgi:hypothetical protein
VTEEDMMIATEQDCLGCNRKRQDATEDNKMCNSLFTIIDQGLFRQLTAV